MHVLVYVCMYELFFCSMYLYVGFRKEESVCMYTCMYVCTFHLPQQDLCVCMYCIWSDSDLPDL